MAKRRIALLGATGSIGRQALEVIEANGDLEVCALASGSQPLDALAARHDVEHVQVGGDVTELLDRAEPDLVLNAVVGFAGVGATLWALERGVTLALANKESLVAAGELALAAWKRGGGLLVPVDSEHSAVFQCLEGRAPETIESIVLTASGGPFRNHSRADLESVTVEEALAHPTWSMGPKITIDSATLANKGLELIEAHFLFGLDFERIDVVVHPASVVHAPRPLPRRRRARTPRLPGHARPDLVRAHVSRSSSDARPGARLLPGHDARVRASGPGALPAARRSLARRASAEAPIRARSTRRTRWRSPPSSTAESASRTSRASSKTALAGVDGAPANDLPELVEADAAARRLAEGALASRMSIVIAILGLALLILVHEAGHFFASLAVGLRPRRFYVGFPPAIVKTKRNGIEYGVGDDPAGRLREHPGHAPADTARRRAAVLTRRRGGSGVGQPRRPRRAAHSPATTSASSRSRWTISRSR